MMMMNDNQERPILVPSESLSENQNVVKRINATVRITYYVPCDDQNIGM